MTSPRRSLGLALTVLAGLAFTAAAAAPDSGGAPANAPDSVTTSSDLPPPPGASASPDTPSGMRGTNGGPTVLAPNASQPADAAGTGPAAAATTAAGGAGANAGAQAAPTADGAAPQAPAPNATDTGATDTGAPDANAPAANALAVPSAPGQTEPGFTPAPPGGTVAVLRGLDKITARVTVIDAPINTPVKFGKLRITARYCYKAPPEDTPEVAAFLQINDTRQIEKGEQKVKMKLAEDQGQEDTAGRIFSGWMFASSPALNALEHPVYDVWLVDCKTSSPDSDFGAAPKVPPVKEEDSKQIK